MSLDKHGIVIISLVTHKIIFEIPILLTELFDIFPVCWEMCSETHGNIGT